MELLRDKKNHAEAALQVTDDKISEIMNAIEEAKKRLEKTKIEYSAKGGGIVTQRQDLFNQRSFLTAQIEQDEEQLIAISAGALPLMMVRELLEQILAQAEKEHDTKLMQFAIEKMHSALNGYVNGSQKDFSQICSFITYMEEKAASEGTDIVFDISDQCLYQLYELIEHDLQAGKGKTLHLMADCNKKKAKLDEIVEKSLRDAAIWDECKDRLKKSALGMSGGQQQRLCIARALAVQPEVLLMDEPTSALDPISTSKIEDLAMELKKDYTIVMVTHNMQQAVRVSDNTAFFLLGEVVEYNDTEKLFSIPSDKRTEDYITGRFG